jgi:N-methylhydantoinase A
LSIAVDIGGTFTDLVVEDVGGTFRLYKTPTDQRNPIEGVVAAVGLASVDLGRPIADLLGGCDLFIHATTRALNAVLTGEVARTAFLTTEGHRDILLFREGGRTQPFNHTRRYPPPYVPRRLTYEIRERIAATGEVVTPLDEAQALEVVTALKNAAVEAVGVCLLWSIVNPEHELLLGRLLDGHLSGVPYTLSHRLNPCIREYRRASSTCIDASLKPVMTDYLREFAERLQALGFAGRLLIVASNGGVLDVRQVAEAPIHCLGSGPAMAPVAGRHYADRTVAGQTAIVADAGGTSYDVSVVRRGRIPWTREAWVGEPYVGHITGFPSVDVRSIGAGGGSIAWVDEGRLLHVGPRSAGSVPGPACYGLGGSEPTVTDAAVVLGYIDPDYFLGGAMPLDAEASCGALERRVGAPLGLSVRDSAAAVLSVVTEEMARAIEEVTVHQGIDPAAAVLVGGGGAVGLNVIRIARRLGCTAVVIPDVGAGMSAAGALLSDLTWDTAATFPTATDGFNRQGVNRILEKLGERCALHLTDSAAPCGESLVEFSAEARYPDQVWELEVPLRSGCFALPDDVEAFRADFHAVHEEVFGIRDEASPVEIVTWRARSRYRLRPDQGQRTLHAETNRRPATEVSRDVYWGESAVPIATGVVDFRDLGLGMTVAGPAVIEMADATVVIDPEASAERRLASALLIHPWADGAARQEASRPARDRTR